MGQDKAINHELELTVVSDFPIKGMNEEYEEEIALSEAEGDSVDAILKASKIDPDTPITDDFILAKIGPSTFATLGNFSCITGKAKSKKTFLVTSVVAAFLKGENDLISTIKYSFKNRIVWFDTEQSKFHVQKSLYRALAIADGNSEHSIEVHSLRPYSPKERKEAITRLLIQHNKENDIAFVVIDGIRDLVTDINDPEQATDVVTWLMKITDEKNLHICTVLHQNKSDNNARGHIGTEIINKAETVLSVQKVTNVDNVSEVKPEQCRDIEFAPFAFAINENGLPFILSDYHTQEPEPIIKKLSPLSIPIDTHKEAVKMIFAKGEGKSRADLLTAIKLAYGKLGFQFGDSKAKEFLHHLVDSEGLIEHNGLSTTKSKYGPASIDLASVT